MLSAKEQHFILHLIKGGCENFGLIEKESVDVMNNIIGKDISGRTFYNYKKKLYDTEIFTKQKDPIYDTRETKYLLLGIEETNKIGSLRDHKMIADKFIDRKDIFHNENKQMKEIEKINEILNYL